MNRPPQEYRPTARERWLSFALAVWTLLLVLFASASMLCIFYVIGDLMREAGR